MSEDPFEPSAEEVGHREIPAEHQYRGVAVEEPPEAEPEPTPEVPISGAFNFKKGYNSQQHRLDAIEKYLEKMGPRLAMVILAVENMELEKARASQLITYRCMGLRNDGTPCGELVLGKAPEFRTYEDRLICPHHSGELTPMEPVLG